MRGHHGQTDRTGAERDLDRLGLNAWPPEALHHRSRHAQQHGFGQAELHNPYQNDQKIHRKRGKHHRQTDLQARSQNGNEEITPEDERIGRVKMGQLRCETEGSGPEDKRNICLRAQWHDGGQL